MLDMLGNELLCIAKVEANSSAVLRGWFRRPRRRRPQEGTTTNSGEAKQGCYSSRRKGKQGGHDAHHTGRLWVKARVVEKRR